MREYIKHSLNASILYENNTPTLDINILSGKNSNNNDYFLSNSINYNDNYLDDYFKKNPFMDKIYVEELINELNRINEFAKNKNLYFSSFLEYETQNIKIYNSQNLIEEYRVKKMGNIALTDSKKAVFHKNIILHDSIFETIKSLKISFTDLQNEVIVANNYTRLNKSFRSKIIFSPEAAGYFVHEIFGHPLEGDLVSNNISLFSGKKLGYRLCNLNYLNIIDTPNGVHGLGLSEFDDEGEKLKDVILVKNGCLNGYICNKEISIQLTGTEKYSSCSRSSSYNSRSIPRMRTTYIDNNTSGECMNSIIKNTTDAYLIKRIHSGWIHPITGDYSLFCGICSNIKNGEIIEETYGLTIKGNILETLENIDEIGNDLAFQISTCVKDNQPLPVGIGSPTLVVKNLLVEG